MTSTPSPSSAAHRARRYAPAGLTGVALLLTSACEKEKAAAPPPPVVEVLTVIQRDVPIYMEWIGSLDGNVNALIRPQVTGYLIRQNHREGDLVKQGQPLFEIDPRTCEAAVYGNLDFLLIGRCLGLRVLGIYQTAFQLGMTPLEIVLQLVNRVQYPIYARLREQPAALLQAFNRSARSLLLILGPVAALLCFARTDLLALIGGGKWLPAVPLIQVLVWASLLRGISQLFPQLYNATGRPDFSVVDALFTGATLVSGFALALWLAPGGEGAQWVAWVWLLGLPTGEACDEHA